MKSEIKTLLEIGNEIKALVMAPYVGRPVTSGQEIPPILSFDKTDEDKLNVLNAIKIGYKVVLKPLDAITAGDATKVGEIMFSESSKSNKVKSRLVSGFNDRVEVCGCDKDGDNLGGTVSIFFDGQITWDHEWAFECRLELLLLRAYQFLQSRGYDLPHYLLNGQTLKEAGLAVYE